MRVFKKKNIIPQCCLIYPDWSKGAHYGLYSDLLTNNK